LEKSKQKSIGGKEERIKEKEKKSKSSVRIVKMKRLPSKQPGGA